MSPRKPYLMVGFLFLGIFAIWFTFGRRGEEPAAPEVDFFDMEAAKSRGSLVLEDANFVLDPASLDDPVGSALAGVMNFGGLTSTHDAWSALSPAGGLLRVNLLVHLENFANQIAPQVSRSKAVGNKVLLTVMGTPDSLSTGGGFDDGVGIPPAARVPPSDNSAWTDEVIAQINQLIVASGSTPDYIEIWNEPDRYEYWNGSLSDYHSLYTVAAPRIAAAFPSVQVGGMGLAGAESGMGGNESALLSLIDLCVAENLPLDFLSWHNYGMGLQMRYSGIPTALRARLQASSLEDVGFLVSEWNIRPNTMEKPEEFDGSHAAANFVAMVAESASQGIEGNIFFMLHDVDDQGGINDLQGLGMGAISAHGIKKPVYRVMELLLPTANEPVVSISGPEQDLSVAAHATLSGTRVRLFLTNDVVDLAWVFGESCRQRGLPASTTFALLRKARASIGNPPSKTQLIAAGADSSEADLVLEICDSVIEQAAAILFPRQYQIQVLGGIDSIAGVWRFDASNNAPAANVANFQTELQSVETAAQSAALQAALLYLTGLGHVVTGADLVSGDPVAIAEATGIPIEDLASAQATGAAELRKERVQLAVFENMPGASLTLSDASTAGITLSADALSLTLNADEVLVVDLVVPLSSPSGNSPDSGSGGGEGDSGVGSGGTSASSGVGGGSSAFDGGGGRSAGSGSTGTGSMPAPFVWDETPVDLGFAFVNEKPAGRRGAVRTSGEQLVFADGTPARFWGVNVMANAVFGQDSATVQKHAKRIAASGWNLVRLFHIDSASWVRGTLIADGSDSRTLRNSGLADLDWWIHCLRQEGVYVWLDLHVGRTFRSGDNIDNYAEMTDARGRGYTYLNPDLATLMDEFSTALLSHVNPHTGLALGADPALVALLVTNENDLTQHHGSIYGTSSSKPGHRQYYLSAATAFAEETGFPEPSLQSPTSRGNVKLLLADLEADFFLARKSNLNAAGWSGITVPTSWWAGMGVASLLSLSLGDVVDVHSYGEQDFLSQDPAIAPNFIHRAASAQLMDRPLTISEWNVPWPRRDRAAAALYMAAQAAFQGWDATVLYGYQQTPLRAPDRATEFGISSDPAFMAIQPAVAMAYRKGMIAPARTRVVFAPGDAAWKQHISVETSMLLRTAPDLHKLTIQLPQTSSLGWLPDFGTANSSDIVISNPATNLIGASATQVVSDTGELMRDWGRGLYTVNTPGFQAVGGNLAGGEVRLSELRVSCRSPYGVVVAVSLDGKALKQSSDILLTILGDIDVPTSGALPWRAQGFDCDIALRNQVARMRVYPISPDGSQGPSLGTKRLRGELIFQLSGVPKTFWYRIRPSTPSSSGSLAS